MGQESSNTTMEINTWGSLKIILKKEKGYFYLKMEIDMKVNLKMGSIQDQELIFFIMATIWKGNIKRERLMDLAERFTRKKKYMKVFLRMI